MSLEDFLFNSICESTLITNNEGNTRTHCFDQLPQRFANKVNKIHLIRRLKEFNQSTEHLRSQERKNLYYTFLIPKKSGGVRRIDAPNVELMEALRNLKSILENDFGALYHTCAFAYIKKRCTIDAVKRHQKNESRWFGKFDLSNFFGSTTIDFAMKQFSVIYPFSEIMKIEEGKEELKKALELAFLNGGLPQGTPVSPLITNIIMIPIDHKLSNGLRDFNKQRFVYTRYADDFIISSRYSFKFREIERYIVSVLAEFEAPFTLKAEKTRYGSSAGQNWNLGVMLTKDNKITIGREKKKRFECILSAYAKDVGRGVRWATEDVQVMAGQLSYYRMVEGETIDAIVEHIGKKLCVNILAEIKKDLR